MLDDNKEEFIKGLIGEAINCSVTDIFRKRAFCLILSKILDVELKLPFDITKDISFFRSYVYFQKILESPNNLDFLDKDTGVDDILKFDDVTATTILSINNCLDDFIGRVSKKLTFGSLMVNFENG